MMREWSGWERARRSSGDPGCVREDASRFVPEGSWLTQNGAQTVPFLPRSSGETILLVIAEASRSPMGTTCGPQIMSRRNQDNSAPEAVPAGSPPWVTTDLILDTIETWQPYYGKTLTGQEALAILTAVANLADALESQDGEALPCTGAGVKP